MHVKSDAQPVSRPHTLTIDGRNRATITGVNDVDSFNEAMIVMNSSAGERTLVGR